MSFPILLIINPKTNITKIPNTPSNTCLPVNFPKSFLEKESILLEIFLKHQDVGTKKKEKYQLKQC